MKLLALALALSMRNEPADTVEIYALYPARRLLPARVRVFIDMVVEQLR